MICSTLSNKFRFICEVGAYVFMKMSHILIEGYCNEDYKDTANCRGKMGVDCFECKCFSFTECPNEIAITNDESMAEEFIGFGGDMESTAEDRNENIKKWKSICKSKIHEAYSDYMKEKK